MHPVDELQQLEPPMWLIADMIFEQTVNRVRAIWSAHGTVRNPS
jgi:hypothetical protein